MTDRNRRISTARQLAGAIALAALAATSSGIAQAAEVIPSIGLTKSTDENAGDARGSGGLALRVPLLPYLNAEGGITYRQDSFENGDITVRQWPVTASLWFAPFPVVYAGGGLGWYRTTTDYASSLAATDETTDQVGVHLGGGFDIPMSPQLALDLNGRYVFMQKNNDNIQVPTTFNPDFWNLALGLAIKF